jgi:hypothetical protein
VKLLLGGLNGVINDPTKTLRPSLTVFSRMHSVLGELKTKH